MIICVPVSPDGSVGPHWGKAPRVAVAEVLNEAITAWAEFDVGWDQLHDAGTHGSHHARIVTFLREQDVDTIVCGGMGSGMQQVTQKMGLRVFVGAYGDARVAVLAAASIS